MKKVTGIYYSGHTFTATIDNEGNLNNITQESPDKSWDEIRKGESLIAKQPNNGIALRDCEEITGDYLHTQVWVISETETTTPNSITSDVIVSPIFSNNPDLLTKGSDAANDTIFGENCW